MSESTPETNTAIPPVVILCEPQLGENIGMVARAMANFGLHDLRLINRVMVGRVKKRALLPAGLIM